MNFGVIEMSIKCPRCDSPIHVNGPTRSLLCGSCQSDVEIPTDFWKGILEDVCSEVRNEFEEGEGTNSTIFGTFNTSLMYGRLKPYCLKCKKDFELQEEYGSACTYSCPECGTVSPVAPAPEWLRQIIPSAKLVVNAPPESSDGGEEEPAVSGPIAFFCPQCGGSLMIDGSERLIPCSYCNTSVYLPDDLWLRLHPARTKNRWFIGFDQD
jgi:Zn finger protein HypA/HybF involved in hydrogenase expression